MTEPQLQIKAKPFALWVVVIFVACFVSLLHRGPFLQEDPLLAWTIWAATATVAAVAGAFIICGLATARGGFRSGQLGLADLTAPAVLLLGLALLFVGQLYLPKVTGTVELCLWIVLLAMWLFRCRSTKGKEQDRATP